MSEKYQGQVHKVLNRNGRWSLLMNNEEWYGLGRKAPTHKDGSEVQEGDTVRFNYEDNTKNGRTFHNVVEGSLQAKKGDGPPPRTSSGQRGGKSGGGGRSNYQQKEQYWADKEERDIETQKKISMAGAYNTAIATIAAKVEAGLLKFTGKSVAAKVEAYEAALDDEACRLYFIIQSTPVRHDELMAATGDKPEPALEEDLDEPADDADDEPFGDDGDDDDWD
jgi:hypothetical protein